MPFSLSDNTMSTLGPVLAVLNRIADALEAHNRTEDEWVDYQKTCHDEGETLNEKRYQEHVKRQEEEAARVQRWHDEAERLTAQRQQEQVEREEKLHERLIEVLLAEFRRQVEVRP